MNKILTKKLQMGFISLSVLAVLVGCRDSDIQEEAPTTDDPTEEVQPEDASDQPGVSDDEDPTEQTDDATTEDDGADQDQQTAPDTTDGIYNVDFQVTLDDAIQTFYDTFGQDVTIDQIEFDSDRGEYEYNISGWDQDYEYDLDVNADTGDVTEEETEADDDADDTLDLDNIITPQEAMDIAVQESGSEIIEEWTLEEDDGLTVYEIDVENGDDVKLDAATGDIIPD